MEKISERVDLICKYAEMLRRNIEVTHVRLPDSESFVKDCADRLLEANKACKEQIDLLPSSK